MYRRAVLEQVGGFDERFLMGQDAELSWRVLAAGYDIGFEPESRVKHYHEDRWLGYFRTQRRQGYWRLFLHTAHRGHSRGDSYSSLVDHIQPPLAMLCLVSLPLLLFGVTRRIPAVPLGLLVLAQVPMTWRLVRRTGQMKYVLFAWMSFWRAFWRGVGLTQAALALIAGRARRPAPRGDVSQSQPTSASS